MIGYCLPTRGKWREWDGMSGQGGENMVVQETRAQIWPNLALEYICHFMIDSLSPDSFLFKSASCQTVNFGHLMLYAFEK